MMALTKKLPLKDHSPAGRKHLMSKFVTKSTRNVEGRLKRSGLTEAEIRKLRGV